MIATWAVTWTCHAHKSNLAHSTQTVKWLELSCSKWQTFLSEWECESVCRQCGRWFMEAQKQPLISLKNGNGFMRAHHSYLLCHASTHTHTTTHPHAHTHHKNTDSHIHFHRLAHLCLFIYCTWWDAGGHGGRRDHALSCTRQCCYLNGVGSGGGEVCQLVLQGGVGQGALQSAWPHTRHLPP